jgi:hypothetical protein
VDAEIHAEADRLMEERLSKNPVAPSDVPEVYRQIVEQVKAAVQVVPPGFTRQWEIDLRDVKSSIKGKPLQLRVKFNAAEKTPSGTYLGLFYVGVPNKTKLFRAPEMSLAADTFHEFEIPPDLFDENGLLTILFRNQNDTALLFPIEDGFEVLYREGGFGLNFFRALGIIFCWISLFATLGLAAASFLSFPVAAFVSFGLLAITLSTGTMTTAVTEGTVAGWNAEKGTRGSSVLDPVVVPVFRGILAVIDMAKDFSPIDSLSTGRSITWGQLTRAFAQMILLLGGIMAAAGITIFTRRELATAQGTQ